MHLTCVYNIHAFLFVFEAYLLVKNFNRELKFNVIENMNNS